VLPVAIGADEQRTRATVKVQDGCNAGCSFCIIPRARGGPRSVPIQDAIAAATALEARGYREIVLTGVLLGSYGTDLAGQPSLATLIQEILQATSRLRIRVSSIEPQDVQAEWLDLWAGDRLCRHLHVPLQSGCDTILAAMRRKYDTRYFRDLVATARRKIPDLAVTTDVLVGFPGEDEAAFEETLQFATALDFAGIHVFRYSARPGTPAARLPDQVPEREKSSRGERLRALAASGRDNFHARFIGSRLTVLWEQCHDGLWRGLTGNYLHAYTCADRDLHNQLGEVVFRAPYADGLWADLPASPDHA
jgi:threonylcarbamoyladenosine tRNA methylthiotransferase MtaB